MQVLLTIVASVAAGGDVFDVVRAYDRIAKAPVWPGFDGSATPLLLFDGDATWLVHHPNPPAEFEAVDGHDNVRRFDGRHAEARANSTTELAGVMTATADVQGDRPADELAALALHEAFHVWQGEHHPDWTGNELDLLLYPVADAELLALRRLETEAMRMAFETENGTDRKAFALLACKYREKRLAKAPKAAADYERGMELKEGLAQYIQFRSIGKTGRDLELPAEGFSAEDVRTRCYRSGAALAFLLDHCVGRWQDTVDRGAVLSLDQYLRGQLRQFPRKATLPREAEIRRQAEIDAGNVERERETRRRAFLETDGWSVEWRASTKAPLFPNNFDPWNMSLVGRGEVLHTRWVKFGDRRGTLEVLDRSALSTAAGDHPLFQGVSTVLVTGLPAKPVVEESDGKLELTADGVTSSFRGARVEEDAAARRLTVEL